MGRAVYAGSFDPPTRGHQWVHLEAERILGSEVALAVAYNSEKPGRWPWQLRVAMLRSWAPTAPIREVPSDQFLASWAEAEGFDTIVRGVRSTSDFTYEAAMSQFNREIAPSVATMMVVPPRELRDVSSSFVMSLVGLDGWEKAAAKFVTPYVLDEMRAWGDARRKS
jgi:pantetheine-phosphate adenylyltransferase